MDTQSYDVILIVGFGGPERPDDVMPFLENVVRGRNVPRERLLEVAEHYHHFGGVSPINQQVRDLIHALRSELDRRGIDLPIEWGNRNWHPFLADTMGDMVRRGVRRALGLVLSAYSSYSGCRQYREDLIAAREQVGPEAPLVDKARVFFNHPLFIQANGDRVKAAFQRLDPNFREQARLIFTAHSIPDSMAAGCRYVEQLRETCRLVAEAVGVEPDRWDLVYQSRSGPPQVPWLGPDILEHLDALHARSAPAVVVHPVGFLSDHMEVLYDLDEEAKLRCETLGIAFVRSETVGVHPDFVAMLGELVEERLAGRDERRAIGRLPASHDVCPVDCCPAPVRGGGRPGAGSGSGSVGGRP